MWPSHWEIIVIFLVILLLFGARRIPEMAQGLGKGIREFRKAVKDVQSEVDVSATDGTTPNTLSASSAPGQVARQPEAAEPQQTSPAPPAQGEQGGARG